MEPGSAFFLGFVLAGVIGFLSSLIVGSWNTMDKIYNRMFVYPPNPAMKPIVNSPYKSIGTDVGLSPIGVLSQGCFSIVGQLILQAVVLTIMAGLIWWNTDDELPEQFFVGIFFSAVIGFLLQQLRLNFKKMVALYRQIVNPPSPIFKPATPPNNNYTAAVPATNPFDLVVSNSLEIAWRLAWAAILLYLLYQSFIAAYSYLSSERLL